LFIIGKSKYYIKVSIILRLKIRVP
jgi:hypothetical protein